MDYVRRWLAVLIVSTFALQSTAILTVIAADVCVDGQIAETSESEDDDCPPTCLRCACCAHVAPTVLRLAYRVSHPMKAQAQPPSPAQHILAPDPRAILHVPLSLAL